jgi:uncharacterized protein YciI
MSATKAALYAVHTRPVDPWALDDDLLARHMAYLRELEARGASFLSGPLGIHGTEWSGEGLTILRAGSLAAAEDLMAREPFAAAGVRSHEISPWLITSGHLSIELSLGAQASTIS